MNRKKIVVIISILVIVFSVVCSLLPLITKNELADKTVISTFGETVTLYGKFLLTGLFGYMLYTYMSYAFLMYYNDIFLLYVANMTLSFYGFVLCVMILLDEIKIERLKSDMPTKGLRIFLFVSGVMIFFMWIGRIVPTIGKDTAPAGLDNCTTLVIQAMDMGIIVPACFVIAYLLRIKHKLGYILGPVIIVKAVTLVTAVLAMAIYMKISGVEVDVASFVIFGPICIASYIFFFIIMRKIGRYNKSINEG